MAKKKAAKKPAFTSTLKEVGVIETDRDPIWETGRPLLVGEPVEHGIHGRCILSTIGDGVAEIRKSNDASKKWSVPLSEVTMTFDQLDHLASVKWKFGGTK